MANEERRTSRRGPKSRAVAMITINQLVAHNLTRARRSVGWTQEETAERLQKASGKRWSSATLSAAERSINSGRSRLFDANEIAAFSRVFNVPVSFFFLPIETPAEEYVLYAMNTQDDLQLQTEPIFDERDMLTAAVPLRYSEEMISAVNRHLKKRGLSWSPSARVEWDDGDSGYDEYMADKFREENPDALEDDEFAAVVDFAKLIRGDRAPQALRLLAEEIEGEIESGRRSPEDDPWAPRQGPPQEPPKTEEK